MTSIPLPHGHRRDLTRTRTRLIAAVVTCAVIAAGGTPPLNAQPFPDADLIAAVLADPEASNQGDTLALNSAMSALEQARELLPESVRDVPVMGVAIDRAASEIVTLESAILTNRATRDRAVADLARLEGQRQGYRAQMAAQRERRRQAGQEAEELRGELGTLAVAAYVGAGNPSPSLDLDAESANEAGRQQVLVEAVDTTLRERLAAAEARRAQAGALVEAARVGLVEVVEEIEVTTARLDHAIAELAVAEPALPVAMQNYRDRFMTSQVRGADFTVVALDAYRSAANQISIDQPNCRLSWSILAGIGRVESRHGTYGGATLRADGTTSRRIIGIALDGGPGVMLIPDTDGGALDGDAVYDRAVGPMQFIPSTWRMVRRDGNGNGRMDPHNIYDASLAAAVYLCRSGSRLDQPSQLNRAILTYNRSQSYVNTVLNHRRTYDRLNLPG